MSEPTDLVDKFYVPFVRPLGNLVVLFALAEAEFLALVVNLTGRTEKEAQEFLLNMNVAKVRQEIVPLAEAAGIEAFEVQELSRGIEEYYSDRGRRNRLIHDEWYPSVFDGGAPGTRGLPRKKDASVVWDKPSPEGVWELAQRFHDYGSLFSHVSYVSRQRNGSGASEC